MRSHPRQYLHESRHLHAVNRVRGEKGRFVNQEDFDISDQDLEQIGCDEEHQGVVEQTLRDMAATMSRQSSETALRKKSQSQKSFLSNLRPSYYTAWSAANEGLEHMPPPPYTMLAPPPPPRFQF